MPPEVPTRFNKALLSTDGDEKYARATARARETKRKALIVASLVEDNLLPKDLFAVLN